MKKLLLAVSAFALIACETAPDATKQTEAEKLVAALPVASPSSNFVCWDGSVVFNAGQCPSQPAPQAVVAPPPPPAFYGWDGSVSYGQISSGSTPTSQPIRKPRVQSFGAEGNGKTVEIVSILNGTKITEDFTFEPAVYDTVTETVVVQEATTELVTIPPTYDSSGNVLTAERIVERTIPAKTRSINKRVKSRSAQYVGPGGKIVPADDLSDLRHSYLIKDTNGNVLREFENEEAYQKFASNPYKRAVDSPVSTFSSDVDTASYAVARRDRRGVELL